MHENAPPTETIATPKETEDVDRRRALYLLTAMMGTSGVAVTGWKFLDSMSPAADALALATIEVDLSRMQPGQAITVQWQGKPVFIRHRLSNEIAKTRGELTTDMRDPEQDSARTQRPEWLILVGVCTHLGCVPSGQSPTEQRGEYGGWFCPCHGSQYDLSGRIRKGPAPRNLAVPPYTFLSDSLVRIG